MNNTFETLTFYRGVSAKYPTDRPSILTPRLDRRPKNSSSAFHKVADAWFERRFGTAYRSKGLFLTSKQLSASTYAATEKHVMRIVPLSAYKYCWSSSVRDLLFAATNPANTGDNWIESYLEAANYKETGLEEAHELGHEVMLYCEQYIAMPIHFFGVAIAENSRSIIVPS